MATLLLAGSATGSSGFLWMIVGLGFSERSFAPISLTVLGWRL